MFKIRIRAIVGLMIFLGYFLTYVVRYNLSVHIVDMAQVMKRDESFMENGSLVLKCCVKRTGMIDIINWDDTKMGKLFSAYHIGYCVCFPIFHSIGDRLGPTWVVGIAGLLSGLLSCLTPASAYYHFWALFLVRIIKGFCAGAMQPSMVQVLRYWVPPIERNHFMWAYCESPTRNTRYIQMFTVIILQACAFSVCLFSFQVFMFFIAFMCIGYTGIGVTVYNLNDMKPGRTINSGSVITSSQLLISMGNSALLVRAVNHYSRPVRINAYDNPSKCRFHNLYIVSAEINAAISGMFICYGYGITTGTFSTFLMCAAVQYYSRWPVGFYISGGTQIAWSIVWVLVVTDYPRKHPCISDEELAYLFNTIGNIFTIKVTNAQAPWRLILRSVPFWALCILNFGYSWMIISLCIHGPLYYSKVAKYSIYSASALTALPFFLRLVLGTILIQTFHYYKHKPRVREIKHLRKYFIFVSHVIPGLLVCISWMLPIIPGPLLLTLAVVLTAAGMDLTLDLCYELTPTFVNSINTVIKIIGNTSGIIVSLCVGQVTNKFMNLPIVWKHIWCFHASILFMSGLVFLIWGETQVQPWNQTRRDRPRRKYMIKPMPSIMSNITEVEESSVRSSLAKVTTK